MIVDFAAARLHNVDIFTPDGLLDLDSSLPNGKFGEEDIGWGDAEVATDCFVQLRVGAAPQNDDVANHPEKIATL